MNVRRQNLAKQRDHILPERGESVENAATAFMLSFCSYRTVPHGMQHEKIKKQGPCYLEIMSP